jgi:sugar phosphate isomerase/epimerase
VYVACSTLCFSHVPFARALRTIGELQFQKIDLALHEAGPHLKPSEVAADVNRAAQMLRVHGNFGVAAIHMVPGPVDGPTFLHHLKAVCRLARMLTVPLVCLPAAPRGSDLESEAIRLSELTRLSAREGILLTVETHKDAVTADPLGAAELCQRVRGLGLTLDPSHYMVGEHRGDYDIVYPHVRHVRLRDTASEPPRFQVRVGQGEVEYGRIVSQLARYNYERCLSVDIHPTAEAGQMPESEVRKLKYLLESLL